MVKIKYDSELFQQRSYSTLSQVLTISPQLNQFVSKRNPTLPCCADKISQNLQKEFFSQPYKQPS